MSVNLMFWESNKESPPSREGYFLVWVDHNEGYWRRAYFDGYRNWYCSKFKARSERLAVSHWMDEPDNPSHINVYPTTDDCRNETIDNATIELYNAVNKFQTVMSLVK